MGNPIHCSAEEMVAHLQSAVEDVFQTMLNTMITLIDAGCAEGAPRAALPSGGEPARVQFEAVVPFSGPRNGAVVLQCTAEGAMDIARGLLMLEAGCSVPLEEVQDAIGECANMVSGSLKTRALDPYGVFHLGVPQFGTSSADASRRSAGQLAFRMSEGCAAVEVWMEESAAA
ncbi:MAG: chemotaxis protein CheX [Planctomycetes bacterium]|nr:chemotaxis protein CheX [Planctomycetota bacterium]